MNENKEIMAKNIKRYMSILNVNATEICKDLGIKQNTFSDWVNAKTYPRIDKIEMMANYFGVSKSDLVEEQKPSRFSRHPFEIKAELNPDSSFLSSRFVSVNEREYTVLKKYREADEVGKEMVHRALNIEIKQEPKITVKVETHKRKLSQAEKEFLEFMEQGKPGKQLSQTMGITRKTVKKRRKNGIS